MLSKNAKEDGRLRKHLEERRPCVNQVDDRDPWDSIIPPRNERIDLRRYDGVIPGGNIEASHGVEDVCRIEPFDTPIEGSRDLPPRVTEKVVSRCAEGPPPSYLDKQMCVYGAIIDSGLDLWRAQLGEV